VEALAWHLDDCDNWSRRRYEAQAAKDAERVALLKRLRGLYVRGARLTAWARIVASLARAGR
jgi:hypothetical protein